MRKILLVIVLSLSYFPVHIVSAQNNEEISQRKIETENSIVRRMFTGGRIGMGVGLPSGSPFLGLGMQFDISNRLTLLVGGTKLVGWMGAVGIRYCPGTVNDVYDHIYQYMHGRMGVQSISVLIMILVRKEGGLRLLV